ncbi:unnamed protein product, partial [Phaeothamnion confervicola]
MRGEEGRKARLNKELARQGQKVDRLADFLGELPLALFVPEDLALVQGSPSERRRYLDLILCKMYPAAVDCLARYQKVLASRNILLKRRPLPGNDELEPYDQLLAPLASELVDRRRQLLATLAQFVHFSHDRLAGEVGELALVYRPQFEGSPDEFLQALAGRRGDELRRGTTLIGPHRDDFEIRVNGVDMRQFGSQGQCRTLALALRLAQASFFQEVG